MSFVVNILENFLGSVRKNNDHKGQAQWDCPMCDNGRKKGNLEVNYKIGVYKCWSCKDINHMSGPLMRLVKKFGTKSDVESYTLVKPDFNYDDIKSLKPNFLELPKDLNEIHGSNTKEAQKVREYLNSRAITDEMIKDFKMMYSTAKGFKGRVIIPSFNEEGDIEYYVSRAIYKIMSPKYRNPDYDKDNIIFFEQRINWEADIYLVEGVFDAIRIPNAIPMLGKYANNKLMSALMEKSKADVIIALDGEEEAQKDAINLYNNLNILRLTDRVKMIEIKNDFDLSEIHEKFGKKGILNVLNRAKKL